MLKNKPKIVAIVGPTASGKTAIGVKLAKKFNGEIVSADSRQIFRGLDLGTGKEGVSCQQETRSKKQETNNEQLNNLTIQQLKRNLRYIDNIPQWMIDICVPEEEFNLFRYTELAKVAIEDILSRGKLPIIVGGTGLYVQALVEGFMLKSEIPARRCFASVDAGGRNPKSEIRNKFKIQNSKQYSREQLNNLTIEQLQTILKKIEPEIFEKLSDNKNPHRLIRAIERAESGTVMTKIKPDWDILQIAVDLPREELNKRIDKRVEDRFEAGMLEEVEGLLESGVDQDWLVGLGLEYRIITSFILKIVKLLNCSIVDLNNIAIQPFDFAQGRQFNNEFQSMKEELKLRSHQYAKRQVTWFKRFSEIVWLSNYKEIEKRAKDFLSIEHTL